MVECEFTVGGYVSSTFFVLIDTWWNVNSTSVFSEKVVAMVLIDTWWNVNTSHLIRVALFEPF